MKSQIFFATSSKQIQTNYYRYLVRSVTIKVEGVHMGQQTSMPRYYIRDAETNELWCLDAVAFSGKATL